VRLERRRGNKPRWWPVVALSMAPGRAVMFGLRPFQLCSCESKVYDPCSASKFKRDIDGFRNEATRIQSDVFCGAAGGCGHSQTRGSEAKKRCRELVFFGTPDSGRSGRTFYLKRLGKGPQRSGLRRWQDRPTRKSVPPPEQARPVFGRWARELVDAKVDVIVCG